MPTTLEDIAVWLVCGGVVGLLCTTVWFVACVVLGAFSRAAWPQAMLSLSLRCLAGCLSLLLAGLGLMAAQALHEALRDGQWHLRTARIGNGMLHVGWRTSPAFFVGLCALYAGFVGGCVLGAYKALAGRGRARSRDSTPAPPSRRDGRR